MVRVLTSANERFIRKNYLKLTSREIGERLGGIPRGTVTSFLKREGLRIPKKVREEFRRRSIEEAHNVPQPEDDLIRELFLLMPVKTLADLLGRSHCFVVGRMKRLKLKVPREIIEQRKQESRIKPGNVPSNKGKKRTEYMTLEGIRACSKTQFRKGQQPANTLIDGAITIRWRNAKKTDGRQEAPHWYIRLSKGVWQELQIFEWERVNGPVPPKHVLICIDGDTLNIDPSNWKPIPMKENMLRNSASLRLIDTYVAQTIVGSSRNKHEQSQELYEEILQDKNLLELKRQQLLLNRVIKSTIITQPRDQINDI